MVGTTELAQDVAWDSYEAYLWELCYGIRFRFVPQMWVNASSMKTCMQISTSVKLYLGWMWYLTIQVVTNVCIWGSGLYYSPVMCHIGRFGTVVMWWSNCFVVWVLLIHVFVSCILFGYPYAGSQRYITMTGTCSKHGSLALMVCLYCMWRIGEIL